ncbi:extracellular metallo proteinase NpIII [Aspergillus bertholletiae]|uniref:Extracellular metalloproteinase n=1 Tax=Aspergillus bertholletiae TaxID=1226010 RepID=A0A5N7AX15_9EURO|nr:extracellular metallo proteinase NpIII [Aspergillus bertholletiae]
MQVLSFIPALALATCALAHPAESAFAYPRRPRIDLERFRLSPHAEYIGSTLIEQSYVETATELVRETFPNATFRLQEDHYIGNNGVAHVHFRQTVHGIDIDNVDFNVNVGKDGKVFSYGNSFYTGPVPGIADLAKHEFTDPVPALKFALTTFQLSIQADVVSAEATKHPQNYIFRGMSGAVSDPTAVLVYFMKLNRTLSLTWRIETDIDENRLLTYVDAETAVEIHGVVDYVSESTFKVYGWGINDPSELENRLVLTDPWDVTTSPLTWFGDGQKFWASTRGNNAIAQENFSGKGSYINNSRPDTPTRNFTYEYAANTSPKTYINASVTQLLYTANTYYDLLYTLGFTEKAGNFPDGSGTNNANFATPPDGKPGRMRMYMFTQNPPPRDTVFEAGVIIHEYTHGLSTRLTGGPDNSRCLNAFESGSMGEGWGDFMATAIRLKPHDTRATDYGMGTWVDKSPWGIRQYLYSTSTGTVWATILYEVLWTLIDKHGKNDSARPIFDQRGVPQDGKYLMLKLVVDGMAL